jgi:hypothetical protein
MPKVQTVVENFFGKNPLKVIHPNEVVAMGSAIQGYYVVYNMFFFISNFWCVFAIYFICL